MRGCVLNMTKLKLGAIDFLQSNSMGLSKLENRDPREGRQKGLTLIEVLTALLLLSLVSLSIPAIFSPAAQWINKARIETWAVNYAASLLDELRCEPEKIDEVNCGKTAAELSLVCASPCPGMTGQISRMQPLPYAPLLYDIMVTVTWTQGGQMHTLNLSTVIRKE